MIVVLDASAALEIIFKRESAQRLRRVIEQSKVVLSTQLYKAEVANALWKYLKSGFIVRDMACEFLALAQALVDEFYDISENNNEAMCEAIRLNHSVYDMLYLTLARRTGAVLATTDKKLIELCKYSGVEVIPG